MCARIASQALAGFYKTQDEILPLILRQEKSQIPRRQPLVSMNTISNLYAMRK
jgi:hypothetical protein